MGGQPRKKRGGAESLAQSAELAADAKADVETVLKTLNHVDEGEIQHVLKDLETEVDNRCKRLALEAESCVMSLRNTFHVELLRIPKSVRQMSLRAFCEQYGEDIKSVLRSAVEEETKKVGPEQGVPRGITGTVVKAPPPAGRSLRSSGRSNKGGSSAAVNQTPSASRSTRSKRGAVGSQTPMGKGTSSSIGAATPSLRAVRQGESILSLNGSPLAVDPMQVGPPETCVKGGLASDGQGSMFIEVPLADGAVTSVDILRNPDAVAGLDDNAREAVQKRIQALQNGLATVLKQIQAPGK